MDKPQFALVDGSAAAAADAASEPAQAIALAISTPLPPALMSPAVLARLILKGDVRRVKALLTAGLDPNTPDPATGVPPIFMAARLDDTAMLIALLEAGADVNAASGADSTTALSCATGHGQLGAVQVLLAAGANPDVPGVEGGSVLTEAICDKKEEVALALIAAGARVNPTDGSIPPLHAAAYLRQVRLVSALLAAGACATTRHRGNKAQDPVHHTDCSTAAGATGRQETEQLPASKAQDSRHQNHSTAAGSSGRETGQLTALDNADMASHNSGAGSGAAGGTRTGMLGQLVSQESVLQGLSVLLGQGTMIAIDGPTALDMAAAAGWTAVLTVMLTQQPRPNAQVLSSALAFAAMHLHPGARKASQGARSAPSRDHMEAMELLLEAGADPNLQEHAGARVVNTPLMDVAMKGDLAAVRLLLRSGADVNAKGLGGDTALCIACRRGHTAVVKELLSSGASLHTDSDTQFVQACYSNNADIFDLLLAAGMELMPDSRGMPPLVKAALLGADAVVGRLLSAGAPIDQPCASGLSALHYAAMLIVHESAQGRLRALKVLLAAGADPNAGAHQGLYPPLSAAASTGNVEAVQLLLEAGAEVNAQGREGITPLQQAAVAGREGVMAVLLAAGADPRPALASVEAGTQPNAPGPSTVGVRKLLREACDRQDAAALADRLAAELIAEEEEERGGSRSTVARGQGKSRAKGRAKGRLNKGHTAHGMASTPAATSNDSRAGVSGGVEVEGGGHLESAGKVPMAVPGGREDAASPASSLVQSALSSSQPAALHWGMTGGCSGQVAGEGGLDSCCVVCMERRHSTVLVPCGHAVMCTECCAAVQAANDECPMCREPIEAVLQLQV